MSYLEGRGRVDKLMFVTMIFLLIFGVFVYVYGGGMFFLIFSLALSVAYFSHRFMNKK